MISIQKYLLSLSIVATLSVAGCAERGHLSAPIAGSQVTPLELRDYQTEKFDTNDVALVMKVLFDVLRDEGFVVSTFNKELGMISASKITHFNKKPEAKLAFSDLGLTLKPERNISLECTATVAQFGGGCKARIGFQVQTLRSSGKAKNTAVVESPQYYRRFFGKLQKGLFLENQNL